MTDYVTRCTGGAPVQVAVATDQDTSVSVDGQAARGGRFDQAVALRPGQAFSFSTARPAGSSTYHVRCLPGDFPAWTFSRQSAPTQDLYVVTPQSPGSNYVTFFDGHGVPVWWYKTAPSAIDGKILSDGTVAFAHYDGASFATRSDSRYEVRRLDGSLVRELKTVGTVTDYHELLEAGNGNFLLVSYRPRDGADLRPYGGPPSATVLDAEVQEVTPAGDLVWSWNSKDHLALSETADRWWPQVIATAKPLPDGRKAYDQVHLDSAELDGDSMVISLRHTDAVYRINRTTGAVQWKLGGTSRRESLTTVGDPFQGNPLGGQHDARVLSDGSISVHDNGTGLSRAPRAVRYVVDARAGTARLAESISDPQVRTSPCCGSARKLDSGNWLMSWGGSSTITEVTGSGSPVFRLTLGDGLFSYRAFPVRRGQIDRQMLRDTMTAQHPR